MSIEKDLENSEGFRKWLEAHDARHAVGMTKDCCGCPLANYINSVDPNLNVRVGCSTYTIGKERLAHNNTDWMTNFINELDETEMYAVTVSAEECIAVLNKITA